MPCMSREDRFTALLVFTWTLDGCCEWNRSENAEALWELIDAEQDRDDEGQVIYTKDVTLDFYRYIGKLLWVAQNNFKQKANAAKLKREAEEVTRNPQMA